MMGRSHTTIGAFSALLVTIQPEQLIFAVPLAVIGSWMPDIDHRGSKMGRILFPISFFVSKMFEHRTATHSWIPIFILCAITLSIHETSPEYSFLAEAFTVGFLSHIFSDMFTVKGVKLFYPFGGFISFTSARTGGFFEKVFVFLISAGIIALSISIN